MSSVKRSLHRSHCFVSRYRKYLAFNCCSAQMSASIVTPIVDVPRPTVAGRSERLPNRGSGAAAGRVPARSAHAGGREGAELVEVVAEEEPAAVVAQRGELPHGLQLLAVIEGVPGHAHLVEHPREVDAVGREDDRAGRQLDPE